MNIIDGTVFGYWTASSVKKAIKFHTHVLCKCKCGTEKYVRVSKLVYGTSKSCGCFRAEIRKTHGMTTTAARKTSMEYWVWNAMVQRCTNKNDAGYKNYGGRGITVCDKWRKYEGFIEDMGLRPSDKHSLGDKIARLFVPVTFLRPSWFPWRRLRPFSLRRLCSVPPVFSVRDCVMGWSVLFSAQQAHPAGRFAPLMLGR